MADLLKKWEPVEGFKAHFTGPRSDQNRTPRTCEIPQRRRDRWEQSPKKLRLSTPRVKRNRQKRGEYCLDSRQVTLGVVMILTLASSPVGRRGPVGRLLSHRYIGQEIQGTRRIPSYATRLHRDQ